MILITIIVLKNWPRFLRLCLNAFRLAFRLVVLLISSGTLFHNATLDQNEEKISIKI